MLIDKLVNIRFTFRNWLILSPSNPRDGVSSRKNESVS